MAPKKYHLFVVRVPAIMRKRQAQSFVLRSLRGEVKLSPTHPFWPTPERRKIAVKSCLFDMEADTVKSLKEKLQEYFRTMVISSGVYCDIMEIVDDHLAGKS